MLMTVAHRVRLRPRSHSPVVRWIRNPLSSDTGVQIPLSAPIKDKIHHETVSFQQRNSVCYLVLYLPIYR